MTNDQYLESLNKYQDEITRLNEVIKEIEKEPARYGVVLHVGKATVDISTASGIISMERNDTFHKKLKVGDQVRVFPNTGFILGPAESYLPGSVQTVKRVIEGKWAEIGDGPQSRLVRIGDGLTVTAGHEVLVDQDQRIVIASLGEPKTIGTQTGNLDITWEDIGGLEDAKAEIRDAVEQPVLFPDIYKKYGKKAPAGILLYGPPGCGKTLLAKALSRAVSGIGGVMLAIKGPEVLDPYVGVAEQQIRNLFRRGRTQAEKTGKPTVIFIDEAESILSTRGSMRSSDVDKTIVPAFLAEMGGIEDMKCMVVLATNKHDSLDPAVIRDGRVDRRILVPRPDINSAASILKISLNKLPIENGETADSLAQSTAKEVFCPTRVLDEYHDNDSNQHLTLQFKDTINGAMLAGIVERASGYAIQREVAKKKLDSKNGVTVADLKASVNAVFSQNKKFSHMAELQELAERQMATA